MKESDSIPPGPSQRCPLRHLIVQSLLKGIIGGELTAGTRLITSKLAARFGVSATPIREALVELEQSGNVELLHHRGAVVKPFGRKEIRDFYAVRRLLECEAVLLACRRVDHELLSSLRTDLEQLVGETDGSQEKWVKDFFAVDRRIHRVAIEHCSNQRLVDEIQRYHSFGEAINDTLQYGRTRHHESVVPLLDFLNALEQHQAEAGATAMERHISLVAATVESVMFDENKA